MIGSLVGAGAGLAGSIIGGISASKARKRQMAVLDNQAKENQRWYDEKYNQDFTQTAESQAALTKAKELANAQLTRAEGGAAVMGGTDESVAQAKAQAADTVKDVTSNIAANATAQKNAIESQYLSTKSNIENQKAAMYGQQASASAQAGSQAMSAGMGLVGADLQSHLSGGKGVFESMFSKNKGGATMTTGINYLSPNVGGGGKYSSKSVGTFNNKVQQEQQNTQNAGKYSFIKK